MIKPVYNRHTAEKKKSDQDQDSLITSVGDISDEDGELPLDNVVSSDTIGHLQDKDLEDNLLTLKQPIHMKS